MAGSVGKEGGVKVNIHARRAYRKIVAHLNALPAFNLDDYPVEVRRNFRECIEEIVHRAIIDDRRDGP